MVFSKHLTHCNNNPQCFENQRRYDSSTADIDCNSLILTSFSMTQYCQNVIVFIAGLVVKSLRKIWCNKSKDSIYGT